MIDTKTLTCANCHSGDFTRLGDNEFKCTHCGSITLVEDDVAQRLEKILQKLQAPTGGTHAHASNATALISIVLVLLALAVPLLIHLFSRESSPPSRPATPIATRQPTLPPPPPPPLDPGLVKISDLHVVNDGKKMVGMVRNDSKRVVRMIRLTLGVYEGNLRKNNKLEVMSNRLLPGEALPIEFWPWSMKPGERFEIIDKSVSTDDHFRGRVKLDVEHQQLVLQGKRLRFIGQLSDNDEVDARSIRVRVMLFNADGRLIGYGDGPPESLELARGETTNFDVSVERYENGEIASMQYVIDSDRVDMGDAR